MIYIPSTRLCSSGNTYVTKEGKRAISDAPSPPSLFFSLSLSCTHTLFSPSTRLPGEISRKCASHAFMYTGALLRGAFKILRTISYPAGEHLYNTLYFLFPGVFPAACLLLRPRVHSTLVRISLERFSYRGKSSFSPWILFRLPRTSLPGEIISS